MATKATKKKPDALPLGEQLILATWFARQLGFNAPADMLEKTKDGGDTGEDSSGNILALITGRDSERKISNSELTEMDTAIRGDLAKMNRRRSPPLKLKYFQYLAALSAEYFLRRRKESADDLMRDINNFATNYNIIHNRSPMPLYDTPADLAKLAFWMATGSGKTLLMHLNYWQCLRHLPFEPNNILLITPNSDMTNQHLAELRASGIPCRRHNDSGGALAGDDGVCVLDIHKLSDKPGKQKQSETVSPDFFESPNLVFVDEGHKGASGGDKGYFDKRDRLVRGGGFALEYSATFGQAFAKQTDRENAKDYGRAIAFDYSYRYFHSDGYGKDFFVMNTSGGAQQSEDTMLLGNLLSFCQQRIAFDTHPQKMAQHNIESPLLLMLGAQVVGTKSAQNEEQQNTQTDIVRIVDFLRRAAADDKWLEQKTADIIKGTAGILDNSGKNVFHNKFDFLRRKFGDNIGAICQAMREKVFHTSAAGSLRFSLLKKTAGKSGQCEIALRINDNKPFALVYVGDARKLRERINTSAPQVQVDEDLLQESLFAAVNNGDSPVNILIGAKKFMEGWSSWRVCGIGLLNVGRSEGPLIIQLFGRGVRLQGEGLSLKRSDSNIGGNDDAAADLHLLETLNIFAVRAEFMNRFRDYLQREGVMYETFLLPVQQMQPFPPNLPIPQLPKADAFDDSFMFDKCGGAEVNESSAITIGQSDKQGGDITAAATTTKTHKFDDEICRRINFGDLYVRLLEEQNNSGKKNIIITPEVKVLRAVLEKCEVKTDNGDPLKEFKHLRLQQVAFSALRKAADNLYNRNLRRWQRRKMKAGNIGKKHDNVIAEYKVSLRADNPDLEKIRDLIRNWKVKAVREDCHCVLPRLYYETHLYNPLLLGKEQNLNPKLNIKLTPPGLNPGEKKFVIALRDYVRNNPLTDEKIYLLRNLPNVGVGFALDDGKMFYPDFILWIERGKKMRVVFVEPHGMLHANAYKRDGKAKLWRCLHKMQPHLQFDLDSYIISATKFDDLQPKYDTSDWTPQQFAKKHILFMDSDKEQTATFATLLKPPE